MKEVFIIELFGEKLYYKEDINNTFKPAYAWVTVVRQATHYPTYSEAVKALEGIENDPLQEFVVKNGYLQIHKVFIHDTGRDKVGDSSQR